MQEDWKSKLAGAFGIDAEAVAKEVEQEKAEKALRPSAQGNLIVTLDRRRRAGKQVTLVGGFTGSDQMLEDLGKTLKARCGAGGSAKDGEIIIQGDFRDKVVEILTSLGYKAKRGN